MNALRYSKVAVLATRAGWAKCPPYLALCATLISGTSILAQTLQSGTPVTLYEVLTDTVGTQSYVRFRFISVSLTRNDDYEQTANNMTHLCEKTALPYLAEHNLTPDVIVISVADRETEFGVADPDATQFFEAFRPVDNTCIWEGL